jgi:hypothetical protein
MTDYHRSPGQELADLRSVAELKQFLERKRSCAETFEEFERELGVRMRRVECELKTAELTRYDVEDKVIHVEGKEYRRCLDKEPKIYLTSSGPVRVERNLFRTGEGGRASCPLEMRAGIIGACTPVLARQVCFLMGQLISEESATVFKELGIEGPSASTCDRLPKVINPVWERNREAWESALREKETVPVEATVLAVSLDGVMVADSRDQATLVRRKGESEELHEIR